MQNVKLTMGWPEPVLRQTPHRGGRWGDWQFVIGDDVQVCDFWAVYDGPTYPQRAYCRKGHVVLITQEPPCIRGYHPDFLKQFSAVLSFRTDLSHPCVLRAPPPVPWHVGSNRRGLTFQTLWGYDELKRARFEKTQVLSVICSNKTVTEGHRQRLAFVNDLMRHFGPRLHVYGSGFRPILDKWEGLAPYRYHIAIENSRLTDYWTEKASDGLLAGTMLLYDGCPNLQEYFPSGCFRRIDRNEVAGAIGVIEQTLAEDPWEAAVPDLLRARDLVLDEYNIFPMLVKHLSGLPPRPPRWVRLREEETFGMSRMKVLKRRVRQALSV